MIDFRSLIKAGVHFGHQKTRWCPKMAPYIWGFKNNIHLIDVSKTANQLAKACKFLESVAAEGKPILWVGTKKAAREIIRTTAADLDMPYVYHRWIGGTLSNNDQVKKSVTKLLHYEDILVKAENFPHYTKKELNVMQKLVGRLSMNVGGIRNLTWPLGAIVLVDVRKESSALKEAAVTGIPVVALVDTNSDPTLVDYVIPANDDAPKSIKIIIDHLSQAVAKGKEVAIASKAKAAQEAKDKKAEQLKVKAVAVAKPAAKAATKPAVEKIVKTEPKKVVEKVTVKVLTAKTRSRSASMKAPFNKRTHYYN